MRLLRRMKFAGLNVDLKALGQTMAARKAELTKAFKSSGPPTPETRAMHGITLKVGQPVAA